MPALYIERGNALVERIKPLAQGTVHAGVMGGVGGFGALFRLAGSAIETPFWCPRPTA
jgi:phosphoribosylaminoimidazole (AIR) synthetase